MTKKEKMKMVEDQIIDDSSGFANVHRVAFIENTVFVFMSSSGEYQKRFGFVARPFSCYEEQNGKIILQMEDRFSEFGDSIFLSQFKNFDHFLDLIQNLDIVDILSFFFVSKDKAEKLLKVIVSNHIGREYLSGVEKEEMEKSISVPENKQKRNYRSV
jgi:hypothetical protein